MLKLLCRLLFSGLPHLVLLAPIKESPIPIEVVYQGLVHGLKGAGRGGENSSSNVHHHPNEGETGAILEHVDEKGEWKFEGAEFTVDGSGKRYEFKEYAPKLFAHLRATIFGIDHGKYSDSLTSQPLIPFENPGRGGSIFYKSSDGRFLLKHLLSHRYEIKLLKKKLASYAKYMGENKHSFLTKYCGVYSIEESENPKKIIWFFAMPNLVKPPSVPDEHLLRIDYQFDIKGHHLFNRMANEYERRKAEPTLKDNDFNGPTNKGALFPKGIHLDKKTHSTLMDSLKRDVEFLANVFHVHDYSLFLGVHFNNEQGEGNEQISHQNHGGIRAFCVDCKMPPKMSTKRGNIRQHQQHGQQHGITIYAGLVDMLTAWYTHHCLRLIRKPMRKFRSSVYNIIYRLFASKFKCFISSEIFHVKEDAMDNGEYQGGMSCENLHGSLERPNLDVPEQCLFEEGDDEIVAE